MQERWNTWLGTNGASKFISRATFAGVLTTLILAAILIPKILDNTDASRRTDDLTSCRATYRADIDHAMTVVLTTHGDELDAVGAAAVAAIRQDPTTLALVAAQIETATTARQAAIGALLDASDAYDAAVRRSREDPDKFLADCEDRQ